MGNFDSSNACPYNKKMIDKYKEFYDKANTKKSLVTNEINNLNSLIGTCNSISGLSVYYCPCGYPFDGGVFSGYSSALSKEVSELENYISEIEVQMNTAKTEAATYNKKCMQDNKSVCLPCWQIHENARIEAARWAAYYASQKKKK